MEATHHNLAVLHDGAINPIFSRLRMPIASLLGWPDSSILARISQENLLDSNGVLIQYHL